MCAVGREVAAAAMAVRAEGRGRSAAASAASSQRDVEPGRPLHRDPLAAGALVLLGHRQDQVAELAEAASRSRKRAGWPR